MSPILTKFRAIYLYEEAIWHKTLVKSYHVHALPNSIGIKGLGGVSVQFLTDIGQILDSKSYDQV